MAADINFNVALKRIAQKGNLAYEYNPFRNYRIDEDMIYYLDRLWNLKEFAIEVGGWDDKEFKIGDTKYSKAIDYIKLKMIKDGKWLNIPKSETPPIFYLKGQLVDFDTDELHFDLNHPVEILPQYSYDDSVNLIINDGKNPPRLINSRFSATERNLYRIVDRTGNNDTNIYDKGILFDVDTSLYKKQTTIPKLDFIGVRYGGNLSIGNYHFYFKYIDDDGNKSDFFAESGLVSVFIGNDKSSIYQGFRNENSHKLIRFKLSNLDPGYLKILVYYTVNTSDIDLNRVTNAFIIDLEYKINDVGSTLINITGFEHTTETSIDEINLLYLIYQGIESLAVCQNRLFIANVDKPNIDYRELLDLSLRFYPHYVTSKYNNNSYLSTVKESYYDPSFIYYNTGYWQDDIYRLGIVYIMSDNTLSPVFNILGIKELKKEEPNFAVPVKSTNDRQYIEYDEFTYDVISVGNDNTLSNSLYGCNAKGVIHTPKNVEYNDIIGIKIQRLDPDLDDYLEKAKVKGYFFVRQKRIPTNLCLAMLTTTDKQSHLPTVNNHIECFVGSNSLLYIDHEDNGESKTGHSLQSSYSNRLYHSSLVEINAAFCPDYDVNSPYLNSLFTGGDFPVQIVGKLKDKKDPIGRLTDFNPSENPTKLDTLLNTKIIGVEDNVKLVAIGDTKFAARAGEAEEAWRFEFVELETKDSNAHNIVRGSFGPYLGIVSKDFTDDMQNNLITIKIPGYSESNMSDYFSIRYADKSPYYAISDRLNLREEELPTLYRGDCYICQFTHRVNRNFQDPAAPTNDKIVDPYTWAKNFIYEDGVLKQDNLDKINLGDVNAVDLGLWVTIPVRSSFNLNVRAVDDSNTDEMAMVGHPRGFYPLHPITAEGNYKHPEALCINKGFEVSVSERVNFEVPDFPYIKDEYSNRISYSNIQVNSFFENAFRTFEGTNFRDYDKTYGSITKILELGGNLLCVFEHGVALIPVNERVESGTGAGGSVFINTNNVLPDNPRVISNTYGSLWRDSVIKNGQGTIVYGVDTIGKKIWRTNGLNFEVISDFKVLEFLNLNISLTERELTPIIGVRNVKTHFNKYKDDVMFTFYDNLYGFEEKVWNLCYNERVQLWITFYSWVPSYSANIYNQFFSFNRDTSKWITKLGVSKHGNDFSDGITLTRNVFDNKNTEITPYHITTVIDNDGNKITKQTPDPNCKFIVGILLLDNRTLPEGTGVKNTITYTLERDNFGNYENFKIGWIDCPLNDKGELGLNSNGLPKPIVAKTLTKPVLVLYSIVPYNKLCSELYCKKYNNDDDYITSIEYGPHPPLEGETKEYDWKLTTKKGETEYTNDMSDYELYKDDRGRRLSLETSYNHSNIVILLNIRASIDTSVENSSLTHEEYIEAGTANRMSVDAGYYKSVVAIIPEYNMLYLSTDFWKHGHAGIIDIADKILPTYWYGKQHPFELEFIVADNPDKHKIFDNLEIISNNAEPESFHYEIVGDCYDFADDKKNMYIRQEATKELYQYNGLDITFDHNYKKLNSSPRDIVDSKGKKINNGFYDKSTIFPMYYHRHDTINEVEDSYHRFDSNDLSKNFSHLAGGEIVHYPTLDEYRIVNHAEAVDIKTQGVLRGNMNYKEDKWDILINSLNINLTNETVKDWTTIGNVKNDHIGEVAVPAELNLLKEKIDVNDGDNENLYKPGEEKTMDLPEDWYRNIVSWKNYEKLNKEVKLKDKWLKVRVRYEGKKLAVISAIRTLYRISYA